MTASMEEQIQEQRSLWALSPIDGRYAKASSCLSGLVSEGALIRYRLQVEIAWLNHLLGINDGGDELFQNSKIFHISLSDHQRYFLEGLSKRIDENACLAVKKIEATTNHDVKACEYYLQEVLREAGFPSQIIALVHFACTSEDINNCAYALMQRETWGQVVAPHMRDLISDLQKLVAKTAKAPMLARTHGQLASPTTIGKEFAVFAVRLAEVYRELDELPVRAKMNGAVGNYHAHVIAQPDIDWPQVSRSFIEERLGLVFSPYTTQIETHDGMVQFAYRLAHFNSIAIDLCRDIWGYISLGYFGLKRIAEEVGSSTMPHKINPIDFENAEGNFGLSTALASHFGEKLPISRWQRDLSDSTVLRSYGTMIGYHTIAQVALRRGLGKLEPHHDCMITDLSSRWELLGEAVQTVMRANGIDNGYEQMKKLTRGSVLNKDDLHRFIHTCDISAGDKSRLLELTPTTYLGKAAELAQEVATAQLY